MPALTIETALRIGKEALHTVGATARWETEEILMHLLQQDRTALLRNNQNALDKETQNQFLAMVERRATGHPLPYVLEEWSFRGLRLKVTPHTLIPRPETEQVVDLALTHIPPHSQTRVADLGTGSGAIALGLKAECPAWEIFAVEQSPEALAIARENGQALGLTITWLHGSWCTPLPHDTPFHLIVANPPYIADGDPHLADLHHEPSTALISGPEGLDAIDTIIRQAPQHLAESGALLLEHGFAQGPAVRAIFTRDGFHNIVTHLDLSGKERFTLGIWSHTHA